MPRPHKALYTKSAKVDLDLWPRDTKSIGFLLSSYTTCMWSLKAIWQKLYHAHKVLCTECQSWPWPLTPWPKMDRVPPLSSTTGMWSLKLIGQKLLWNTFYSWGSNFRCFRGWPCPRIYDPTNNEYYMMYLKLIDVHFCKKKKIFDTYMRSYIYLLSDKATTHLYIYL